MLETRGFVPGQGQGSLFKRETRNNEFISTEYGGGFVLPCACTLVDRVKALQKNTCTQPCSLGHVIEVTAGFLIF